MHALYLVVEKGLISLLKLVVELGPRLFCRDTHEPADLVPGKPQHSVVEHVAYLVWQAGNEELQNQLGFYRGNPVGCTELMPCLEVRKKTFVTQPAVPQPFPSHPMV